MFSKKVRSLQLPKSIAIANLANQMKVQGINVIDLSIGQPDFSPDLSSIDIAGIIDDKASHHYSSSHGIEALREEILRLMERKHHVDYIGVKNIIVTPGAKLAIHYIIECLVNPGDSVILPEPTWLSYVDLIKWSKGEARIISGEGEQEFLCSVDDILDGITENTKIVLINSPVNPIGKIWSVESIKRLYLELSSRKIFLVIDAIYDDFDFYKKCFNFSDLILTSFPNYLVYIHGFSKTFAMPGHRLGYIVADEVLVQTLVKLQSNLMTCPSTISQVIAVEMLKNIDVDHFIATQLKVFNNRREIAEEFLVKAGLDYIPPEGAFYLMLKVDFISNDSVVSAKVILEECFVAVVPGIAYGQSVSLFVRLSLVQSASDILEALTRILSLKQKSLKNNTLF